MANYEYKCLQVPELIEIGKKDSHGKAVSAYQEIINKEAADGWEYVGTDTIESYINPGCLQSAMASIPILGVFTRSAEWLKIKIIVFRRVREE